MKIERNKSVIFEQAVLRQTEKNTGKNDGKKTKGNVLFAGDMNLPWDRIEEKRKQARGQAMKVVTDAMEKDRKMEDGVNEQRDLINALKDEISQAHDEIDEITGRQNQLKEEYGIADDSREQKDLELLMKRRESMKPGSGVELTEGEKAELERIDAAGLTDYQSRMLDMESEKDVPQSTIDKNNGQIMGANAAIRGMKMARLKMKRQPMQVAKEEADKILEDAGREILGMMFEDGRKHIDEEAEKAKEEAEKAKEEKEEEEERIEAVKEKVEEMQEQVEENAQPSAEVQDNGTDALTDQILEIAQGDSDIQKELEDIINKMNLISEDLKGAAVDTGI